MKDVIIRTAESADLEALEWGGEYIKYRKLYMEVFRRTKKNLAKMFVADLEGVGVIGQVFVQFYPKNRFSFSDEKQGYIHAFRVKPDYRNTGLGTCLMSHVEKLLIGKKIQEVTLNVAKDNKGGLLLYQKLGYEVFGETTGRWWFRDHTNKLQEVIEPSWRLRKQLF